MATKRTDSELVGLEQQAEQLAQGRKERVTSAHLLAAIAALEGGASALLRDRGLGAEALLRAARSATDDDAQPLRRATQGARAVADRMRAPEPGALHLLISLLSDRHSAAYRALDQCGVDVHRLRLAAMNQALSLLGRSPIPGRTGSETRVRANQAQGGSRPNGARGRPVPRRRAEVVSPEDLRDRRRAGRNLTRKAPPVSAPVPAPQPTAQPAAPVTRQRRAPSFPDASN